MKTYMKTFQYKGQMIKYFNKVAENPDVDRVYCGMYADTGYTVKWTYKQKKEKK